MPKQNGGKRANELFSCDRKARQGTEKGKGNWLVSFPRRCKRHRAELGGMLEDRIMSLDEDKGWRVHSPAHNWNPHPTPLRPGTAKKGINRNNLWSATEFQRSKPRRVHGMGTALLLTWAVVVVDIARKTKTRRMPPRLGPPERSILLAFRFETLPVPTFPVAAASKS